MARLLLIRHGQTKLHRADRFWGKTDIELSETGIRQAEQLRDRLARIKIDTVYASTLVRATATAEIIASRHKYRLHLYRNYANAVSATRKGSPSGKYRSKYPELAGELASGKAMSFPGGESLEQLNQRVQKFLEKLKQHKPRCQDYYRRPRRPAAPDYL